MVKSTLSSFWKRTDSPPSLTPPKPPSLSTPRAGARVQSSGSGLKSVFERPPTAAQIEVSSQHVEMTDYM